MVADSLAGLYILAALFQHGIGLIPNFFRYDCGDNFSCFILEHDPFLRWEELLLFGEHIHDLDLVPHIVAFVLGICDHVRHGGVGDFVAIVIAVMDYVIKIMAPAERNYCYTDSQQLDKQTGCIGHLRGDMDRSGKGFFTSWWDHCPELKTQAFKDEFDDFINALRFDDRYGGIFKNRSSLSRYCYEHKESVFAEDFIPQYGFRVDTPEHAYLLRLNPMQGDYNLYVYCYRREALDRHLKNAERGICFVDPQGKTLFRIPDGDSIRVLRPDGTQHDHICRYIDDHRAEIGSGHLYGMVQFAQQMEQTGSTFVPLRSSLPKQCYSLLLDTGNVVILKRGETGYYKTDIPHTSKEEARAIVEEYNRKLGVTRAQEEAMKGGSMFGFDKPIADPANYDAQGQPLKRREKDRGDAR